MSEQAEVAPPCPVCGADVEVVDLRVWPRSLPASLRGEDEYHVEPCGHEVSAVEANAIRRIFADRQLARRA